MTEYNIIKHANDDFYQPNTIKIEMEIEIEDYLYLLDNRRNFAENNYNWYIPDCLWEYFCYFIKDTGVYGNNRPDIVVDNVIINGDWGDFDNYKQKFETDEDFILIKMKGLFVFLYDNDTRSCLSEFCRLHKQLLCAL